MALLNTIQFLVLAVMAFALFGLMLHALSGQPPRSKRREQPLQYQYPPGETRYTMLKQPANRMSVGEWACPCSTCSPSPDGPNPSSLRLYGSSTANPAETPTPSATAAIPSAYSSSGTGGFDTRGRVLTIGQTPMSTPELLTPSTDTTSSGTTATGGTPGRASREAARLEKRD